MDCQIAGKIRLASTPPQNHWWHVPLYLDARGLTTRRLLRDRVRLRHRLRLRRPPPRRPHEPSVDAGVLRPGTTASPCGAFHEALFTPLCTAWGSTSRIRSVPSASRARRRSPRTTSTASYDARRRRALLGGAVGWIDWTFQEFGGLVLRQDEPRPPLLAQLRPRRHALLGPPSTGEPGLPTPSRRRPTRTRSISFGVLGRRPEHVRYASFYSYTAPEPAGLTGSSARRGRRVDRAAGSGSLALLTYESVRASADPRAYAARLPAERVRGGREARRLGHERLRIELVSDPEAAARAAGNRGTGVRPTGVRRQTEMNERLTIVGLGGSLARNSRSLAALRVALDGASAAGAATTLLDLRELDLPMYNPDDERRKATSAAVAVSSSCAGSTPAVRRVSSRTATRSARAPPRVALRPTSRCSDAPWARRAARPSENLTALTGRSVARPSRARGPLRAGR